MPITHSTEDIVIDNERGLVTKGPGVWTKDDGPEHDEYPVDGDRMTYSSTLSRGKGVFIAGHCVGKHS